MNRTYPTTNDIKHDHVKQSEERKNHCKQLPLKYAMQFIVSNGIISNENFFYIYFAYLLNAFFSSFYSIVSFVLMPLLKLEKWEHINLHLFFSSLCSSCQMIFIKVFDRVNEK